MILDSTQLFQTFLTFILHLRLVMTPHVHMTYVYPFSYVYVSHSHDHMAKRSHHCIMIFLTLEVLFYGHTPTLIF